MPPKARPPSRQRQAPDFVEGGPNILDGIALGGDISEQPLANGNSILCCAVAAIPVLAEECLTTAIDEVVRSHTGLTIVHGIEVHANEIWNGSSRRKTAFSGLLSKDAMQAFFADLAKVINRQCPFVSVAVSQNSSPSIPERRMLKATLMNAAMGRIDTNLRYLTGRHLGSPKYYLDPEADGVTNYSDPVRGRSYMPEAQALIEDGKVKLYYSVDPTHHEIDSRSRRLVQVSDVAAYFVGKYLKLHASLIAQLAHGAPWTEKSTAKLADTNFCLWQWDLLNIEAVYVQTAEEFREQVSWTRGVTEPYRPYFEAGAHLCICSMREAFPRRRLSGIGYWTLQAGGLGVRSDFIPRET